MYMCIYVYNSENSSRYHENFTCMTLSQEFEPLPLRKAPVTSELFGVNDCVGGGLVG
jgi:hypothetical protein